MAVSAEIVGGANLVEKRRDISGGRPQRERASIARGLEIERGVSRRDFGLREEDRGRD